MNWGHKIIGVFIIFVAGMLLLVYKSSKQNNDLVTEDYYGKELIYQQKIDEAKRTASLSAPVNIKLISQQLIITFPNDFAGKKINGDATLYFPADETKDIQQQFSVTGGVVNITVPASYHGLHYVKINWAVEGVKYYYEHKIII